MRWLKGNTHAHTTNSDGDAPPDAVVRWYEEHGYDFLALSDHNVLTPPLVRPTSLTLLPAEEVTMPLSVHVNGLGLTSPIPPPLPPRRWPIAAQKQWLLEQAIAAVEAQGGLAHVNHPNWDWALDAAGLQAVPAVRFLEIFNGHPDARNGGDRRRPSVEANWDRLLTLGRRVCVLATDDAHHYHTFAPLQCNPGRGWIHVQADDRTPASILEAMHAGRFYASTGVTLADYAAGPRELCVVVDGPPATLELIGPRCAVLEREQGIEARFRIPANQPFVRLKATHGAAHAWAQPLWR
ncbi:MAG TPA: CehA/McbA family metallohydrolase [Chloroflexota bacterium]